jgi:hypothetical protein
MKNLLVTSVVLLMVVALATPASAASKMSLSVGPDVLLPMGSFSDVNKLGFGGTVRFQYNLTPMAAVGGEAGYFTWGGKDVGTFSGPSFHGIPVRAFGKYYFMPEGGTRVYGMAEIGIFFGSSGDVTVNIPGYGTISGGSGGSSTGFNFCPVVGVEIPVSGGKNAVDVSVRYDGISATGGTNGSIAFRVGYNFPLGN